jgi:hypothetical protein
MPKLPSPNRDTSGENAQEAGLPNCLPRVIALRPMRFRWHQTQRQNAEIRA